MKTMLAAAKIFALTMCGFAFVAATCVFYEAHSAIRQCVNRVNGIANGVDTSLAKINEPNYGTLMEVTKDAVDAGDLIKRTQLEIYEAKQLEDYEIAQAPIVTRKIAKTMDDADSAIRELQPMESNAAQALLAARESIEGLQPLESNSAVLLRDVDSAMKPLPQIMTNTQSMTNSGDRILDDAALEADKFAHPHKRKMTFWGAIWLGIQYVHRLEPPIF